MGVFTTETTEGTAVFHHRDTENGRARLACHKTVPSLQDSANFPHDTQHCASGSVLG